MSDQPQNFHEAMVSICDTYNLSHKQMVALRQRIEAIYHAQPKELPADHPDNVSLIALAIAVDVTLKQGASLDAILKRPDAEFITAAQEVERVRAAADKAALEKMMQKHLKKVGRKRG